MPPRTSKTQQERLNDGIKILSKLKEIGIPADNEGFAEVKNLISRWVKDGLAVTKTKINFYPFDRYGEITLPSISGVEPIMVLKLVAEAKGP